MLYIPLGTVRTEKKLKKRQLKRSLQHKIFLSNLDSSPCINQVIADKLTTPVAAATT